MLVNVDANFDDRTIHSKFYVCDVCGKEETITSTKKFTGGNTRRSGMCKTCRNRSYYLADPNKHRNLLLQKRYGISLEEYHNLYKLQEGKCAICKTSSEEFSKNLSVDHNHTTGEVRGLLCVYCNNIVGIYENHKDTVEKYLDFYKKGGLSTC